MKNLGRAIGRLGDQLEGKVIQFWIFLYLPLVIITSGFILYFLHVPIPGGSHLAGGPALAIGEVTALLLFYFLATQGRSFPKWLGATLFVFYSAYPLALLNDYAANPTGLPFDWPAFGLLLGLIVQIRFNSWPLVRSTPSTYSMAADGAIYFTILISVSTGMESPEVAAERARERIKTIPQGILADSCMKLYARPSSDLMDQLSLLCAGDGTRVKRMSVSDSFDSDYEMERHHPSPRKFTSDGFWSNLSVEFEDGLSLVAIGLHRDEALKLKLEENEGWLAFTGCRNWKDRFLLEFTTKIHVFEIPAMYAGLGHPLRVDEITERI